jgi:hypothetical protein
MLKVISRASFQKNSNTQFATLPAKQWAYFQITSVTGLILAPSLSFSWGQGAMKHAGKLSILDTMRTGHRKLSILPDDCWLGGFPPISWQVTLSRFALARALFPD